MRFRLRSGLYEVRVGAERDGRVGTVFLDVDVPASSRESLLADGIVLGGSFPQPGMPGATSDLLPIRPTTIRTFDTTDRVAALLRLHWRQGAQPISAVARISDEFGRIVFEEATEFRPGHADAQRNEVDWVIQLPVRHLTGGAYLLSMEAGRRSTNVRRTVRFSVR